MTLQVHYREQFDGERLPKLTDDDIPQLSVWELVTICRKPSRCAPQQRRDRDYPERLLDARLWEIIDRVVERQSSPLWAAPTHAHGWIDPRTLVERLRSAGDADLPGRRYDLLQALIRLAPDGRAEALANAAALSGNVGRVVRWALGGSEGPTEQDKPDTAFWLAAGHARSPYRQEPELAEWGLDEPEPDGSEPAPYAWLALLLKHGEAWRVPHTPPSDAPSLEQIAMLFPGAARDANRQKRPHVSWNSAWFVDWLGMLWPQRADDVWGTGMQAVAFRLDANASLLSPNYVFLRSLSHRDRPWSEIAQGLALLALAARDADVRGYAIDALTEAVADGRAHPEELGRAFMLVTQNPSFKLNRIVEGLQEVARVSDLHGYVVSQVLACWLKAQTALPGDAHYALEPLLELLTRCGIPLEDEARKPLKAVTGSSKTAKLAKCLLEFAPPEPAERQRQFMLESLKGRLERAERWQGRR